MNVPVTCLLGFLLGGEEQVYIEPSLVGHDNLSDFNAAVLCGNHH